jgi:hypothetical protein
MPADSHLIAKIRQMTDLMIAVGTGGPRIGDVNDEYRQIRDDVQQELSARGRKLTIPFADLWEWYGRFSGGDFPTWRSRRQFVGELLKSQLEELQPTNASSQVAPEPTGWERVDRAIGTAREQLAEASAEEHFQSVGLLCREILISLGQSVFDPDAHPTTDGVAASKSDAKRMLDAYISASLPGAHNKVARQHARSAFDLANELQHRRTANFRDAALCMEATSAVVNVIAIVSGRRDP